MTKTYSEVPDFPYTTLFRSLTRARPECAAHPSVPDVDRSPDRAGRCWRRHDWPGPAFGVLMVACVVSDLHPECEDRKSTRLNSSHGYISYAVFCMKRRIRRI